MRTRESKPADLVTITLVVPKPFLVALDAAARVMAVDRQEVLMRAFQVLTFANSMLLGHFECAPA